MNLKIDSAIFAEFPGLVIGVVMAKGINNSGSIAEVEKKLRELEAGIKSKYSTETLSEHPKIDVWRKAYVAFGAKPKENKSSVENLHRLVLQGNNLRHINRLVDIYNLISLKHMLPLGGEDVDKIKGDLILTFAALNGTP